MITIPQDTQFTLEFDGVFNSTNQSVTVTFTAGDESFEFLIENLDKSHSFSFPPVTSDSMDYTLSDGNFQGEIKVIS